MFTWICPQCGREVPPSYNECPDCTARQQGAAQTPAALQPGTPPAAPPPVRPQAQAAPPPRGVQVPAWLMSIFFAVAFIAIGAGAYFGIRHFSEGKSGNPPVGFESPGTAKPKNNSTLQKYVEIVGLRLTEEPQRQPEVRFVVVNHSGAEISDLAANVNLWARTAKSDEEAVGTFSFRLASLGPYEAKDMAGVLNTKLRVYELPDWQNLTAEIQITSPQ